MCSAFLTDMKIRSLGQILKRIARREFRIRQMELMNVPESAISLEREVVDEMKKEYMSRMARLNVYLGFV